MAGVHDLVVFDFNGQKGTRMACDGPEGPTILTALYNYVLLTAGGVEAPVRQPYFKKAHMKQGLIKILDKNIAHRSSGFDEDGKKILAFGSIILGLGSQEFVTPTLRSITSFDKSPGNGSNNVDLFNIMGIPLLHGWLANPEDESLYPYVRDYPCEMLQKYKEFLEGLEEESSTADSDVPLNLELTKDLLDAHKKQLTPHGYATLCQTLSNGDFAVLYWDSKFNILHKGNGDLLLLEKDPNIVRQYPTARWRVFEEVDRDVIYLTSHYLPSEGQPNFERAKAWFESKVSGRVSEPDPSGITGSSKTNKRREQRRRAKKAAESSSSQAKSLQECIVGDVLGSSSVQPLPANKAGEEQGEVQQEAPKAAPISSDDKQVDSDGSTAEENRRLQTELDGNRCHQASGSSQESIQCQPSVCGTSSLSSAKEVKNKSFGDDFLKFLLEFQDGESRLKDGSSTERVPYFEGVVEALKHTGSPKFYVPFEFIKMYDTSLAVDIQDNYPRISEDLTQSVRQYLVEHGVDIAAQLNIPHLPEPSVQSFLSLIEDMNFLEEYDVYSFELDHSPAYDARNMALGYLHCIVNKFKVCRCFGGKWDESQMRVADRNYIIDGEDEGLTASAGYLDLCKFDAVVLQRFKDKKGRLPPYFEELTEDFKLIYDCIDDPQKWERFLLLISNPFALTAPLVRSTFLLDIYRSADSESSGRASAYSPLNTKKGIHDWRNKATAHWLFREVYNHNNFGNGSWTIVYTITKWGSTHWSLLKFSRHFISLVLRYTKKRIGGQQVRDLAIVDIMLGRQLGQFIAQSIRFFILNCDLNDLFSSPWRHFVASDCTDKPKEIIADGIKKFEDDAFAQAKLVSKTSHKHVEHRTGWVSTEVGRDLSAGPLRKDIPIAKVDMGDLMHHLTENGLKVDKR